MTRLSRSQPARLRYVAGFKSARSVAAELSISAIYLLGLEEGRGNPSESLLERLAGLYQCDPETLRAAFKQARTELLKRQLKRP